ncbi:Integrase core domain-containing protein [Sphaerotilus natans]|nr:Integrase core domain-containing protein [Sphaerotilus natans]
MRFSLGAISQAQGVVAWALQAPASCSSAAVLHMDETSWRQAGSPTRHWVWATMQPQVVVYQVLPSRARYVAQALAGERPAGVLVTDRYAVYDCVAPERRQVCWAHLLRDFERIAGRAGAAGSAGPAEFEKLQTRVHQALEPGEPNQNAYVERFNRTFRTEVLDAWLFNSIEQVQAIADDWLTQYNEYRPHDALGGKPPRQFMPRLITTTAADSGNQLSA